MALREVTDAQVEEFRRGCVDINMMFLNLSEQGSMGYFDHWPKRTARENIEWVGRDKTRRRKFRRILEGLDTKWPVPEQAAYLLRAFSGLQLFPDANHRTGLVIVAFTLDEQGWRLKASAREMVALVEKIRPERGSLSARRTVDRLSERDDSFQYIAGFMERHTRKLRLGERAGRFFRRPHHMRSVLADIPLDTLVEDPEAERRRKGIT